MPRGRLPGLALPAPQAGYRRGTAAVAPLKTLQLLAPGLPELRQNPPISCARHNTAEKRLSAGQ